MLVYLIANFGLISNNEYFKWRLI